MSKAGEKVLRGLREAVAHARGEEVPGLVVHTPEEVDAKAIRERSGLSQAAFAARYGFTVDALQNWESGRRRPEGPARTLLKIIDLEPEVVERAMKAKVGSRPARRSSASAHTAKRAPRKTGKRTS